MSRRVSFGFLCIMPFLAGGLVARPLRSASYSQAIGIVHSIVICIAVWKCGFGQILKGTEEKRRLALAGALLLAPFALVALFWVGLGTPWEATPVENRMRYLVLAASAMFVATAFILLSNLLMESGEREWSQIGFAANILAGAAYLVWLTLHVAVYDLTIRVDSVPPEVVSLINVFDTLLFAACVLTYITTAAFAAAMGRVGWLRPNAARAFVAVSLILLFFVVIRGLSFPDPTSDATPWYLRPGFIAGIPAVPWIMPCLLGAVVLRRGGTEGLTNAG